MRRAAILPALAFLALASVIPAAAQTAPAAPLPQPRVRVVLNGLGSLTKPSFGDTRQYTEYAETARVTTSYTTKAGFGPDLAAQVSLYRGLGLLVGWSLASRSEDGRYEARRPHPLYLDRARTVSGELTGYDYKESAVHLDLAYARAAGKLDWSLFAGASLFRVEADLLDQPSYTDEYPYEELRVAATPARRVKQSPTGFNVGGRLDYRFGRSVGAGVLVRYSSAAVELRAPNATSPASFDAGGLQVGAGLRLYF